MASKKSFILYADYRQHLEILSDEEKGQLFMAIFDYAEGLEPTGLSGASRMAFSFIRAQIDRDTEKYQATCERNRSNGSKGGRPPKPTETQTEAKKPSGFCENPSKPNDNRTEAKKPDNDTGPETDLETDPENGFENDTSTPTGVSQPSVPFGEIMKLYNEICVSLPKIKNIDGQRRKAVAARWRTHKEIEVFKELFQATEASGFLKGNNDRNWNADFDWIMKPTNFSKVLEGKYKNKGGRDSGRDIIQAPTLTGFKSAFDDE